MHLQLLDNMFQTSPKVLAVGVYQVPTGQKGKLPLLGNCSCVALPARILALVFTPPTYIRVGNLGLWRSSVKGFIVFT